MIPSGQTGIVAINTSKSFFHVKIEFANDNVIKKKFIGITVSHEGSHSCDNSHNTHAEEINLITILQR